MTRELVLRLGSVAVTTAAVVVGIVHCSSERSGSCDTPGDGVSGGNVTLYITVDDDAFAPSIVTAQDQSNVTLTIRNTGTRPHGFALDCVSIPTDNGCSARSCFPDAAVLGPIPADASMTTTFVAPPVESLYPFHSNAPGDTMTGQFNVN